MLTHEQTTLRRLDAEIARLKADNLRLRGKLVAVVEGFLAIADEFIFKNNPSLKNKLMVDIEELRVMKPEDF